MDGEAKPKATPFADLGAAATEALRARFGDRLALGESVRAQHAGLEGHHPPAAPEAVVFAASTEDVAWIARWCNANRIPLIPHGAGTSLEGHLSAIAGGVSLDLSTMTRITEIAPENLLCTVEAGVTREDLNRALKEQGLFFPIDPGANATLGGMAATRASGTNAVRYGTMRTNVLSLRVVLADGTIIETGTHAAKSAAGYDLTSLFIGSEGTLGIITEVTLRLYGIPEIIAGTCAFDTLDGAVRSVIQTIQLGLPVARIELLDDHQIRACNRYSKLDLPEKPTLFVEFHGTETGIAEQAGQFGIIAAEHGGGAVQIARLAEDRNRLWKARHNAYYAAKALRPNGRVWTTDVCVPIGSLAESISAVRAEIDAAGMTATIVGHVGDGNFHVLFVLPETVGEADERAAAINARMVERGIALGGTCTGEHGVGLGKQDMLVRERGESSVVLMAMLKAALDPAGVLNPGKVLPASFANRIQRPAIPDRGKGGISTARLGSNDGL
jgi:D-lactate dehydrogenase (cytochrome)